MTDLELEGRIRRLVEGAVEVLRAAGEDHAAEKLRRAPIRAGNRYACAVRALYAVEASLRASHAGTLHNPRSPIPLAVEAIALVRLALDAAANASGLARPGTLAWLDAIAARQRELRAACPGGAAAPG